MELLDKTKAERSRFSNLWLSKSSILVPPASVSHALNALKSLEPGPSPQSDPARGAHDAPTESRWGGDALPHNNVTTGNNNARIM